MPNLTVSDLDEETLEALRAQADVHGRSVDEEVRAILGQYLQRQENILTGEERAVFLRRIKETIHEVEPEANVWLFGSHARGDARPESDWDVLVLLKDPVDTERRRTLRHALYDVELDTSEAISVRIYSREEWESEPRRSSSFARNVRNEAIPLRTTSSSA